MFSGLTEPSIAINHIVLAADSIAGIEGAWIPFVFDLPQLVVFGSIELLLPV